MKKQVFKTFCILISILSIFLLLGCTKESLKVNKNSLIMYSLKNGKINLNIKDLKEYTSKKVTIKNKILNENSVITETSNVFDPWLINSPVDNQNDVLFFPYEDGKIISLKSKGHTLIGTINNYIFLCKYENDLLKIIKLDKKTLNSEELKFRLTLDEYTRIFLGDYNETKEKFSTIYTNSTGTYLLNISKNKIESEKISNKVLCGKIKWVKNELVFIGKDLLNSKKLNDKLILIKIKDCNAKVNIEEYNVTPQCFNIENDIVDIQYIDDANLLILAIEHGGNKLSLYKFNKNKYTINKLNEEKIDFQSIKVLNNETYIIGFDKIFKLNSDFNLKYLK